MTKEKQLQINWLGIGYAGGSAYYGTLQIDSFQGVTLYIE